MAPTPRTDFEAVEACRRYREQYAHAPLGQWRSHLDYRHGPGFDGIGVFGSFIQFRPDGTGVYENYGLFSGEPRTTFRWKNRGPCQIALWVKGELETQDADDPMEVEYDFYILEGEREVLLAERGEVFGEFVWFWLVTGPLMRTGE